ncbi:MAG: long-chain fatty acid--CoA ligase [Myxococcales bacterium]|nr:long-chain fatty acid--CoA ligase [Myxococcales bacterium]
MFRHRVKATPDLEAFSFRKGDAWSALSWKQVGVEVDQLAAGLRALEQGDEDRVGILCGTRVEWLLADLAIMVSGGATTTIYPSSTAEDCQYIIENSGSVIIFAEDDKQVAKLASQRDQLPAVRHLVVIEGTDGAHDGWVIGWDAFKKKGVEWLAANPGGLDEVVARITPERLATLIYTSGTTGVPKGVELTHDCWIYEGEVGEQLGFLSSDDRQYLWLPLSHSFGKVLETFAVHIGIPTAVDGEIPKIIENLAVIRPTFMAAAPRIFEKVYNKVITGAKEAGGLKFKIFRFAVAVGREVSKLRQAGKEPTGLLAFKFKIADKLVFSKLRARFGGRVRFFISGSAPLNRDIAEFFHAAGLLILEGYGLTESSAASFVNTPNHNKFGTVGRPVPGTEVRIADDGEILFKGRGVMRGYYRMPEATAETLSDGWLHTGDIGEVDADGHLRITDRKKALIKTSGGKYVAPSAIEGAFKAICPLVSQMVVHGDRRNFCSALLTMDEEAIKVFATQNGLEGRTYEQLSQEPKVIAEFQKAVDQLNQGLASFETIKRFALLPRDFTVEGGELTPSLKVKRKEVEKAYAHLLDDFYADSMAQV